MKKSLRGVAVAIVEAAEDKTDSQLSELLRQVVAYLADHGLLNRWRELEREIHEAWRHKFGVSKITVVSAHPLSAAALKALGNAAQGAELTTLVDERLMGGAIVRIDERRLDGSVLGALTRLKQTLLS